MPDVENGAIKTLPISLAVRLTLLHHQHHTYKPNHIASNSFPCIDLIFCNNQNLILKHGVDLSIFEKCHRNIIFGKINIHTPLPSSYVPEMWNYSKANIKIIQKNCSNFWLGRSFWKYLSWWKSEPSKWNITKHFPKLYF